MHFSKLHYLINYYFWRGGITEYNKGNKTYSIIYNCFYITTNLARKTQTSLNLYKKKLQENDQNDNLT